MRIDMPKVNYMGCIIDGSKHYFSYQVNTDLLKVHCFSQSKADQIKSALVRNGYLVITTRYGWYLDLDA